MNASQKLNEIKAGEELEGRGYTWKMCPKCLGMKCFSCAGEGGKWTHRDESLLSTRGSSPVRFNSVPWGKNPNPNPQGEIAQLGSSEKEIRHKGKLAAMRFLNAVRLDK